MKAVKKRAKIYCVCNRADDPVNGCDGCDKYKRIKPDVCFNHPAWNRMVHDPRKLNGD